MHLHCRFHAVPALRQYIKGIHVAYWLIYLSLDPGSPPQLPPSVTPSTIVPSVNPGNSSCILAVGPPSESKSHSIPDD